MSQNIMQPTISRNSPAPPLSISEVNALRHAVLRINHARKHPKRNCTAKPDENAPLASINGKYDMSGKMMAFWPDNNRFISVMAINIAITNTFDAMETQTSVMTLLHPETTLLAYMESPEFPNF
jgi:hypothetical protein